MLVYLSDKVLKFLITNVLFCYCSNITTYSHVASCKKCIRNCSRTTLRRETALKT